MPEASEKRSVLGARTLVRPQAKHFYQVCTAATSHNKKAIFITGIRSLPIRVHPRSSAAECFRTFSSRLRAQLRTKVRAPRDAARSVLTVASSQGTLGKSLKYI